MKELQYFFNFEDPQGWNDITKDKKRGNYFFYLNHKFKVALFHRGKNYKRNIPNTYIPFF